jgi:hypothetical protein
MAESPQLGAANKAMLAAFVVLLVLGAGLFLQYWMKPPTQPDLAEGQSVAEKFLELVREGRAGDAWESATAEFKSIEGRESFIRSSENATILKEPLHFNSAQQVTVQEQPRTEFLFQSPDAKMVRVLVGYEGGVWKVDRLTL